MSGAEPWWLNGLLYENCGCQLLCPAHVSFVQRCESDPCLGFWGIHVARGRLGSLLIEEQEALLLYESGPVMHAGGWTVALWLDAAVAAEQRAAVESILTGQRGGPWAVLARFVARRLPTRVAPMRFEDHGRRKVLRADGVLETAIESVESRRSGRTASLENLFNVVHAAVQYLARGSSTVTAPPFSWTTTGRHALYSEFSWTGP
jgi:hypothetical protein